MSDVAAVLTIGYEKRDLAECVSLLRAARVDVVLDVRETAWSHKPGFSKTKLAEGLAAAGIQYIHARVAGNPKALRRRARTHAACLAAFERHLNSQPTIESAFDAILRDCLLKEHRVALLCFERHPGDCHRGILAERWAARHHGRVEHLGPSGCPRLVPALVEG